MSDSFVSTVEGSHMLGRNPRISRFFVLGVYLYIFFVVCFVLIYAEYVLENGCIF